MATIRTFSQIVQSMQDDLRLRQPALDTKPSSVARDLVIDNPADQIADVYKNIQSVQKNQSILNSAGKILDQYGSNFGIVRDAGKTATGNAILTFNNLLNNINVASGTTITAKTGVVFQITANIIISASTKGVYSSYASSIADQLHIAGISDQYAVLVPIQASTIGANGNIPVYSLIKTSIPGISGVTNIEATNGGTNPQGDPQYKNEILAGLSGSAAGTARGYQNALAIVSGIQSTYIAIPGDPILTRDGTITRRNSDGSLVVLSTGTGGKVDIWIQGSDFIDITESYVFHDLSGTGDITSPLNAHILGQLTDTSTLTPLERRQQYTKNGQLPQQPVDSLISLSGSVSGSNFVLGVNYELVKDTNENTLNTAFALDNIIYLQNFISLDEENVAKGNVNSVDSLVFNGVKNVNNIHQPITITNDIAILNAADHTQIIMSHTPLTTTLRATNLTTGERYIITNQNINTSTGLNETGEITISGSVLPSSQDLIQVDYTWNVEYDGYVDYFSPNSSQQFSTTGIDWGRSNYVAMEPSLLIRNNNRYNLGITRNADRVYSAFYCDVQSTSVQSAHLTDQTGSIKALRQITINTGSGPVVYFTIPLDLTSYSIPVGAILHISSDLAAISRNGSYTISFVVDQAVSQSIFKIVAPAPALIMEIGNAFIQINDPTNTSTIVSITSCPNLSSTAENITTLTNVVSVKSEITGLELYATEARGTFSNNIIYLATDVEQPPIGENVVAYFNSNEIYNVAKNNGSVGANTIILSTDDVLDFNDVLQPLNDIFNGASIKPIFADYISTDIDVVARNAISTMPFIGSTSTSTLVDKNNTILTSRQLVEFNTDNSIIRNGTSYLVFAVDGAFSSGGVFAIKGTGWFKIEASLSVSQSNVSGLFDLSATIASNIGNISTNYSVVKVVSASVDNGITTQNLLLRGYGLSNNTYDSGSATKLIGALPTSINLAPIFAQNNITLLTIGSTLTLTFYVLAPNIAETIQFTTGRGTLYSRYKYSRVDRVDLISGFLNTSNSLITGNLRISRLSQPSTSSTYLTDYNYFGPVENERINIQYRYNSIIQDATNAIESVRTLTADTLTRLAVQIAVNVSMTIILTQQAINQQSQVLDQVISAVSNLINTTPQGSNLDYSSLLRVATNVNGVAGADVSVFDYVGSDLNGEGNRKNIQVDANEFLTTGTLNIVVGTR